MWFTKDAETGTITVDCWDMKANWAYELLRNLDPALGRVEGDRIILACANGTAEYLIVERTPRWAHSVLQQSTLNPQKES